MQARSGPALLLLFCACAGAPQKQTPEPSAPESPTETEVEELKFTVRDGALENYFYRRGPIAAHAVLGGEPLRLLFAFPADNAGAALWFEGKGAAASIEGGLEPVTRGELRGVAGLLRVKVPELALKSASLGGIRTLRGHALAGPDPAAEPSFELVPGEPLALRRETLCGRSLEVTLAGVDGTEVTAKDGRVVLSGGAGGVAIRIEALQDHPPLTPIPTARLLRGDDYPPRLVRALGFLSYEEKLLAGSWRFLTYFGRDTLLSVRLLMPALSPEVIEAGLGSALERLSPEGAIAHEEDIGEHVAESRDGGAEDRCRPAYTYQMVDDDFMLAPILAHYLLDTEEGRARAESFLARETSAGARFSEALKKNLEYVLSRAAPYAEERAPTAMVPLREGHVVGDWRDSQEDLGGLGGGRFSFSVNAALVPAALEAAARLYRSDALADEQAAARAETLAQAWATAADHFRVEIPAAKARGRIQSYARTRALDAAPALASLDGPIVFSALSLDAKGRPVPVMHSDDGFLVLFGAPSPEQLDGVADRILQPFPAGLRTQAGVLVANPAYAADKIRASFTSSHYHGTTIWSWQHALLAAGLERQLARTDLPSDTRSRLKEAQGKLWEVIDATRSYQTHEVWSIKAKDGAAVYAPFQGGLGGKDESNAVQLWSTAFLAIDRP